MRNFLRLFLDAVVPVLLVLAMAAAMVMLTGCANSPFGGTAASGGATYSYSKETSPEGISKCTVQATSARDIQGGTVTVDENCAFSAGLDTSGGVGDAWGVFGKLVDKFPAIPAPLPAGVGGGELPVSP